MRIILGINNLILPWLKLATAVPICTDQLLRLVSREYPKTYALLIQIYWEADVLVLGFVGRFGRFQSLTWNDLER